MTGHTPATAGSDEEGGAADEEVPGAEAGGVTQGEFTIAPSDSIETILDRLSLSQHLQLFQVHMHTAPMCTHMRARRHTPTCFSSVGCRRTR